MSGEAKDITYRFRWTPEVYAQLSAKRPPAALQVTGSRKQLAMAVIACGALVTGIAALPIALGLSDYDGFKLSLWGAIAALFSVLVVILPYVRRTRVAADLATRARQGEVRVTLGPEGVESQTDIAFTRNTWDSIAEVSEAPKSTLLWIGALIAMPVPDKSLPEGVDRAELLRRIETWRVKP